MAVGNSTYADIGRLPNSDNVARDMPRGSGYGATTEFDADRMELTQARRAFTERRVGADVSLVL